MTNLLFLKNQRILDKCVIKSFDLFRVVSMSCEVSSISVMSRSSKFSTAPKKMT